MTDDSIATITSDEVKQAVLATGLPRIDMWPCSICGAMVGYEIHDDQPFWNAQCQCVYQPTAEGRREWQDLADLVNMQSNETAREDIMRRFGFKL